MLRISDSLTLRHRSTLRRFDRGRPLPSPWAEFPFAPASTCPIRSIPEDPISPVFGKTTGSELGFTKDNVLVATNNFQQYQTVTGTEIVKGPGLSDLEYMPIIIEQLLSNSMVRVLCMWGPWAETIVRRMLHQELTPIKTRLRGRCFFGFVCQRIRLSEDSVVRGVQTGCTSKYRHFHHMGGNAPLALPL